MRLDDNYRRWTGKALPCPLTDSESRAQWIHHQAPYSLVFHNNHNDPYFIYGNECALRCFKYTSDVFCGMPSRFSASSIDREKREELLEHVRMKGIASGYTGYRVDRHGKLFLIHDGTVWEVLDEKGVRLGQAALFWADPAPLGRAI
nr:MEKHLA domain-containing protein [uncultured Pseudomonas sp.]